MPEATVYYDGLCRVCSFEINHYRTMRGAETISFVDITSSDFDAAKEQLDPLKIHEEIHAKDSAGRMHLGVDAFILIWSKLPALVWLSRIAKGGTMNSLLRLGYRGFVKIRPYLPRKSCEDSPYCAVEKATEKMKT